jgi:5-formyltetrahydrofolate cyclo-ligase
MPGKSVVTPRPELLAGASTAAGPAADWNEVKAWRRARRKALIERRMAQPKGLAEAARQTVSALVRACVIGRPSEVIGFCWPFRGEIDLRPLVRELVALGHRAALPAVVANAQPLEFWAWRPGDALQRGVWGIPIPAERTPVQPTAVLAPLVGFDEAGYRLGYGGGYFDRTLASLSPRPLAIGVGLELGRLPTIRPQPHDIPLDAIATERGLTWHRWPEDPRAGGQSDDPWGG